MRRISASTSSRAGVLRLRKYRFALRLAECFLFVSLATLFVRSAALANHLIWLANGVLLAFLLLEPRRRWATYLGIGLVAQVAGCLLASPLWHTNLLLTVLNLTEVLISALLMRGPTRRLPRFTNRAYLLRFLAFGVVAGPLAAGLIYALISILCLHIAPGVELLQWSSADALGAAVATPACVAILRARFRDTLSSKTNWLYLLLLAVFTVALFSQTSAPGAFFIYPLLLLVLLRMGLGWAAVAALFVTAVGCWNTVRGLGPFGASTALSPLEPTIVLQIFIAAGMFMLYSVSVVLESQKATERRLRGIVTLHALVGTCAATVVSSRLQRPRRMWSCGPATWWPALAARSLP